MWCEGDSLVGVAAPCHHQGNLRAATRTLGSEDKLELVENREKDRESLGHWRHDCAAGSSLTWRQNSLPAFELCEPGNSLCGLSQLSLPVTQRAMHLSLKAASVTYLSALPLRLLIWCFAQTRYANILLQSKSTSLFIPQCICETSLWCLSLSLMHKRFS